MVLRKLLFHHGSEVSGWFSLSLIIDRETWNLCYFDGKSSKPKVGSAT